PPVDSAPRLVQPSFASDTDTVFENEAPDNVGIKTTSVLYGVHLASYRRIADAEAGWRKLQRENPDELGLLEPRIEWITIDGRGEFVRLIGGGFSSRDKAEQLCLRLRAKKVYCAVRDFDGQRLSMND
ncbi:MAG TPA: SPOR domain-containing protein, partial [Parvularculaceae bacterium]|nr:SPOR domain-containing protein [Parvularculaceae bacterium]